MGRQPNDQKLPALSKKTNRFQPKYPIKSKNEEPDIKDADFQVVAENKYKRCEDIIRRYDIFDAEQMIFVKRDIII